MYSIYRFLLSFHNKDPPNDIYCITEKPSKHYFTEKFHTLVNDANDGIISTPRIKMAGIRILLFFVFSSKRASSICPTINQLFQKLPVLCLNFLFFHIISQCPVVVSLPLDNSCAFPYTPITSCFVAAS